MYRQIAIITSFILFNFLAAQAVAAAKSVPAGTVVYARLQTAVSTRSSHNHDPVRATVERDVSTEGGVAIPMGAVLEGRIEKIHASSGADDRALLVLRFTKVDIPGEKQAELAARVSKVENAREQVAADGAIQGVLQSEIPRGQFNLDGALDKLAQASPAIAGEIKKAKEQSLGAAADTSIALPAGADLELTLDKPFDVRQFLQPSVSSQVPADLSAAVDQLLSHAPQRASGKDGAPGDPLNLVVIGTPAEIQQTFQAAGWSSAAEQNTKSIWGTVRAVINDEGYGQAPVSQLYLYNRPEDMAWEKMLNTFQKRHHLRLWRSPATAPDGRPIYLGACTHDIGIDVHPGVISHAIDPDLDAERTKVGADLAATGHVAAEALATPPNPLSSGTTATEAPWHTDGRLLVIDLK